MSSISCLVFHMHFKHTVLKTVSATCIPVNISSISHSFYTILAVPRFQQNVSICGCSVQRTIAGCSVPRTDPTFGDILKYSLAVFSWYFFYVTGRWNTPTLKFYRKIYWFTSINIYRYDAILKNKTLLYMDFGWSSILLNITCILNSMHF